MFNRIHWKANKFLNILVFISKSEIILLIIDNGCVFCICLLPQTFFSVLTSMTLLGAVLGWLNFRASLWWW